MSHPILLPRPGALLRTLLTAAGQRRQLGEGGYGKDLDDLASETEDRRSSAFERLQRIEDECFGALARDCGEGWAQFLRKEWHWLRDNVQTLAREVDAIALSWPFSRRRLTRHFQVPALVAFMQRALHQAAAWRLQPDLALWWSSPLRAWVALVAARTGRAEADVLESLGTHLDADLRTLQRWWKGDPPDRSKIGWPHADTVAAVLGSSAKTDPALVRQLAGWLLLASLFQSLPLAGALRKAAWRDITRLRLPRTFQELCTALNRESERRRLAPVMAAEVGPLHHAIEQALAVPTDDDGAARDALLHYLLQRFEETIERTAPFNLCGRHYHHWYSARHAALRHDDKAALALYERAIDAAWWQAGPLQKPMLEEALLFAVGIGDLRAAAAWWDKTFMLGLNCGRKRDLDKQQRRRLSIGFERMFHPRKARERIPPLLRLHGPDDGFQLQPAHLKHPNRKSASADGRMRETPLMRAVREGTLEEVKQLLAAGGDANDHLPESGEGPLSIALHRAEQRREPAILDLLLSLDLHQDTVNRIAGMQRHTPLRMALVMADANVTARLIALGADVEQECGQLPSALCYAMHLLAYSLDPGLLKQSMADHHAGGGQAELHDAHLGALLDTDLANTRGRWAAFLATSAWRRNLLDAVMNVSMRPHADHRAVIAALMAGGADANRRYRARTQHLCEWTPTLYAAEIGDLEAFRLLVEHPGPNRGDPARVLMPGASALERYDALWVAVGHRRQAIVTWLQQRHDDGAAGSRRRTARNRDGGLPASNP